jgi:hypothetical protein
LDRLYSGLEAIPTLDPEWFVSVYSRENKISVISKLLHLCRAFGSMRAVSDSIFFNRDSTCKGTSYEEIQNVLMAEYLRALQPD